MASEKDKATTAGTWLDIGMEILKAMATPAEETKKVAEESESSTDNAEPEPTEGRVLAHYVAYNGRHLTALVIGQGVYGADLAVFSNLENVAGMKSYGLQFHQDVVYSTLKLPGSWHWIERT